MNSREFGVYFGALSPTLAEQLQEAGLDYDEDTIDHLNRDAEAITRLSVRGVLPDSQAQAARKKLMKKIEKCVAATEA